MPLFGETPFRGWGGFLKMPHEIEEIAQDRAVKAAWPLYFSSYGRSICSLNRSAFYSRFFRAAKSFSSAARFSAMDLGV
jgi:hypothetical protein